MVMEEARDPVVVVAPAEEPVSLHEAIEHLRLDTLEETLWLKRTIAGARRWVEEYTRRALITQTLEWSLDEWPGRTVRLPKPPLRAVLAVEYVDADGATQTLPAEAYMTDTRSTPGRLRLRPDWSWPSMQTDALGGVVFRYTAGYGDEGGDVPEAITSAILLMLGHLYENREATTAGTIITSIPLGVERLLWTYRVF